MKQTGIKFADSSWNPIRGCKAKSEGCANCWAERIAGGFSIKQGRKAKDEDEDGRLGPRPGIMSSIAKLDDEGRPRWTGRVQWVGDKFWDPLLWRESDHAGWLKAQKIAEKNAADEPEERKGRRIAVCNMSDLFYPKVSHEWRDAIFGLISLVAESTFLVQTKYAAEMRQYFTTPGVWKRIERSARLSYREYWKEPCPSKGHLQGPLANTWLGVSVENQETADERIPILQDTPAALRYVDAQPLLGELTLDKYLGDKLDWVIAGGESGMQARPCNPAWIRQLKTECNEHQISFYLHQWGAWMPITAEQLEGHADKIAAAAGDEEGAKEGAKQEPKALWIWPNGEMSVNLTRTDMVSMRKEMEEYGTLIDGEEWQQIPEFEENHTAKQPTS